MGLLDPFWNAVDTTIAGAGATVGGAIQGIGDGITATGRNVGDSLAGAAAGYGNYVNDSANYVRDATGAPGTRAGSASNPLGLTRNKEAAKMTGMPKYSAASNKGGQQKAITAPPSKSGPAPKTIAPSDKQRSLASTNAANMARAQAAKRKEATRKAGTGTPAKPAGGGAKPPASAAKASPASAAAGKKPTPSPAAAQAQKKTGGTVTGRPAGKPATKK